MISYILIFMMLTVAYGNEIQCGTGCQIHYGERYFLWHLMYNNPYTPVITCQEDIVGYSPSFGCRMMITKLCDAIIIQSDKCRDIEDLLFQNVMTRYDVLEDLVSYGVDVSESTGYENSQMEENVTRAHIINVSSRNEDLGKRMRLLAYWISQV